METSNRSHLNLTLPIAPNFSLRRNDAVDQKQPILNPIEAAVWIRELQKGGKTVKTITLHGPGDVLTSWPQTMECLSLITGRFADIPVSLTTFGLSGLDKIEDLVSSGLNKITLRVDACTEETASIIYQWIRPAKKTIPLVQGCRLIIKEQPEFCSACSDAGLNVIIRTKVDSANKQEVSKIAETFKEAGARSIELCGEASEELRQAVQKHLPACFHKPEPPLPPPGSPQACISDNLKPSPEKPRVAVASHSGIDVDLHLGQARQLLIYGKDVDNLPCLLETRETPPAGDPKRWQLLAEKLSDCFCLLATHAGSVPREQLAAAGLKVILTDDQVLGVVDTLFGGGKKGKRKK